MPSGVCCLVPTEYGNENKTALALSFRQKKLLSTGVSAQCRKRFLLNDSHKKVAIEFETQNNPSCALGSRFAPAHAGKSAISGASLRTKP